MPIYALDDRRPVLPADGRCWIAPGAHVIGEVRLGADVTVWFNAVIRGDTEAIEVGARCNIQDGAILHADPGFPLVVEEDCTIGHGAIVHGCTIGRNSLVGMGAVVLNGASIGQNCLVGANALVPEGKSFPDNSLIVGTPARAVRTLDQDAVAQLQRGAAHYVGNGRQFAAGLRELE